MDEKRKIQAAMRILGEERLSELLGRSGYFGKPTEALVWKVINQKGETFVRLLNNEAQQCASQFGGKVVTAAKFSHLDGAETTAAPTPATTTSDSSSTAKGWIDSAFGWLKTSSDIGLDWAMLKKDNPNAYVDPATGNLYAANGTLLAMAGTNTAGASNNTLLYIAAGVVAVVVVGAVFLRR